MHPSIFLFLSVLSIFPSTIHSQPGNSPLDLACTNLTVLHITPEQCYSIMNTDPRSASTNLHDLALIAADITIKNCTDAVSSIKAMGNLTEGMTKCLNDFSDTIPKLQTARDLATKKDYLHEQQELDEDIGVSSRCLEDIVDDNKEMQNKMLPIINGFHDVVYVAQGVVGYVDVNK